MRALLRCLSSSKRSRRLPFDRLRTGVQRTDAGGNGETDGDTVKRRKRIRRKRTEGRRQTTEGSRSIRK